MLVKLATYTVNGVNGRLDILLRWLDETKQDIVCLQELKAPSNKFPRKELERAGYGAIWHGQKSWNGVAILARGREPLGTRRGLPGDPDDNVLVFSAWITTDNHDTHAVHAIRAAHTNPGVLAIRDDHVCRAFLFWLPSVASVPPTRGRRHGSLLQQSRPNLE